MAAELKIPRSRVLSVPGTTKQVSDVLVAVLKGGLTGVPSGAHLNPNSKQDAGGNGNPAQWGRKYRKPKWNSAHARRKT